MRLNKRIYAAAAVIFIIAVLCAFAFEAGGHEHSCIGEGCPVCAVINVCKSFTGGAVGGGTAAAAVCAYACAAVRQAAANGAERNDTPVSLKVKLSN